MSRTCGKSYDLCRPFHSFTWLYFVLVYSLLLFACYLRTPPITMSPTLEIGQMQIRDATDASSGEELYTIPLVGTVVSIILAIFSLSVLSAFFGWSSNLYWNMPASGLTNHSNTIFDNPIMEKATTGQLGYVLCWTDIDHIRANTCAVTLAIYIDSWLFVAIATILRWGPGIDTSWDMCSTAIFLCLACYLSTKVSFWWTADLNGIEEG